MKEGGSMLPKRSHSIIWFTATSSKRTLWAPGLPSELCYCSSQCGMCGNHWLLWKEGEQLSTLFEWHNVTDILWITYLQPGNGKHLIWCFRRILRYLYSELKIFVPKCNVWFGNDWTGYSYRNWFTLNYLKPQHTWSSCKQHKHTNGTILMQSCCTLLCPSY